LKVWNHSYWADWKYFFFFFLGTYSIKCSYSLFVILCHSLLPFISTAISFDNSGHVQSLSVSLSLIDSQVKLAYLSMKLSAIIVISPQAVLKKEMGIFQRAFENLLRSYFLSLTCLIYSCSKSIFFFTTAIIKYIWYFIFTYSLLLLWQQSISFKMMYQWFLFVIVCLTSVVNFIWTVFVSCFLTISKILQTNQFLLNVHVRKLKCFILFSSYLPSINYFHQQNK
jgi:hypothetical protein